MVTAGSPNVESLALQADRMGPFLHSQLDARSPQAGGDPLWLAHSRQHARTTLLAKGLPGPRNEGWKYTSLKSLGDTEFALGDAGAGDRVVDLQRLKLPGVEGPRLVFVNGAFRADLSQLGGLPEGVQLQSLAAFIAGGGDARSAFAAEFAAPDDSMALLNSAVASDGLWLSVAAGVSHDMPIHVVHAGADAGHELAWHARHSIRLGAGARITVIEHHFGADTTAQLGNLVEVIEVGEDATLNRIRLQECAASAKSFTRSVATLAARAQLHVCSLELGAGLARRDLRVRLAGEGARMSLRGACALSGRQHVDVQIEVRHAARDTVSDLLWRGVADQRARAVFGGGIVVEHGADGSDAQLSNKNLLLSPHAEIDTKPVLEIYADEVKASHGATVGQLDERAMFYLRSRGLPESIARSMLVFAFCAQVVDAVREPALRAFLSRRLAEHLPSVGVEP